MISKESAIALKLHFRTWR